MREGESTLLKELSALYARADALFAGAGCELSTECCRFGITGREPQLTSIELALLKRALAARGGMPSAKRRALPLAESGVRDERTCPLLDQAGRCSVYAHRPLGCRTFFCARATLPRAPERGELRELVRDLQELAARHQPRGEQPRSLTSLLAARR